MNEVRDRLASVMQEWLGHQRVKRVFAANLQSQEWQAACTVGADVRTAPEPPGCTKILPSFRARRGIPLSISATHHEDSVRNDECAGLRNRGKQKPPG